jgi:hypothetical protein
MQYEIDLSNEVIERLMREKTTDIAKAFVRDCLMRCMFHEKLYSWRILSRAFRNLAIL